MNQTTNIHSQERAFEPDSENNDIHTTPTVFPDDTVIGDPMNENKPNNTTRLYCQNINGIKWDRDGGTWPSTCETMAAIHADIVCLSELNQDINKHRVSSKMRSIEHQFYNHSKFAGSTSQRHVKHTYKPGGTGMLIVEETTSTVKSMTRDRMVRWVNTQIVGDNGHKVTIISAYQVCRGNNVGGNTAANQQVSQLMEESNQRQPSINPRQAFIAELIQNIHHCQHRGDKIVLVGDFNEIIDVNNDSGMSAVLTECGLVDLFGHRLGTNIGPSTYQRGRHRIDYALISPEILPMVQAAGYDPYGYRLPSDHRGFFIDFDTDMLLGYRPSPLASHSRRDFNSKDPDIIPKYITQLLADLDGRDFESRLQQLQSSNHPDHRLAESLDRDLTRAAQHAAKQARRRYSTPWSPAFSNAWALLHFYKLARSKLLNPSIDYDPAIANWQHRYPTLPTTTPLTQQEVHAGFRMAKEALRSAKQYAAQLRNEHLEKRARLYDHLEQIGKAKAVHRLKMAENLSRTYTKIKSLKKNHGSSGVTELKVPRDPTIPPKECDPSDEHWRTEKVPKEIESLLLHRNRQHFGQAEGTPFTHTNLKAQLHYDGTGPMADLVLNGEYNNEHLDDATRLFIKHLQRQTTSHLTGKITAKEFVDKLKRWDESTSTSPSGLHLGHYHLLWRNHGLKAGTSLQEKISAGQHLIITARVALLNYAMKHGYSFDRWKNVVNVMLLKDPGNARIHRLRVIHLYEADYNLLLAVQWRKAMHHAEDNDLLNAGLYGSRAGRSAHEPVFLEVLQNEIYMCSMKSGINFDLDATSCYDRILASIASIASRRMGMTKHVVTVNARTLQEAKFRLKTNLGISDTWYQHCEAHPIHGTGQGSGNSPHIWCFVCSVLFDAFQECTPGATFTSFDGQHSLTIHMVGFVDDCTQRVNDFNAEPQPTAAILTSRMADEAQRWNDLLWSSGGALEIPKCSFHLIESHWKPDGSPHLQGNTNAPNIYVRNGLVPSQVRQKSNYTSHKTLGCHVNPANRMGTQLKQLKKKSDAHADLLQTNILARHEAKINYRMLYLTSVTYPMPVTCFTSAECQTIQSKFMTAIVPRCGFNRNMAKAIRYAPEKIGGAGFTELYTEQHVHTIMLALKHLRSPSGQPGQLLRIALSWVQAFLGVSHFIWEEPTIPTLSFPAPWIKGVQRALVALNAKITLHKPDGIVPTKLRENDVFLMEVALQYGYKTIILHRINACRRYLQAITLADITDSKGTAILPSAKTGTYPETSIIQGSRFNQQSPNATAWSTWRRFLKRFEDRHGHLHRPLRKWIVPHYHCRHRQKYVFDPQTNTLYKHHNGAQYYPMQRGAASQFSLDTDAPLGFATGYPVIAQEYGPVVHILSNFLPSPTNNLVLTQDFPELIHSLPAWEQELLHTISLRDTPSNIMHALNAGPFLGGSDGSVIADSACYGFVISDRHHNRLITGQGPAPGHQPQSFRAEAHGALALRRTLIRLSQLTAIPLTCGFTHYIDNKAVIQRIKQGMQRKYHAPNTTLSPDWDVISMTIESGLELPPTTLEWVKGHQDLETPISDLPIAAQLNCEADFEAGQFQQNHAAPRPIALSFPSNPAHFAVSNRTINSYYKSHIRDAATLPPYYRYLEARYQWTPNTRTKIDWSTYKQIIRPFYDRQIILVKHLHHIAPSGHITHRTNSHYSLSCPSCDCQDETNDHIIQCPAPSRRTWRSKTLQSLRNVSQDQHNDPFLVDILHDGLQRWFTDRPTIPLLDYPERYHLLIQSQNTIGWSHLFRARWSNQWKLCHSAYATREELTGRHADGAIWVRKRGRLLLQAWLDLWQLRNTERHGRDEAEQQAKRSSFLQSQLLELYAQRNNMLPAHRTIFLADAATHMEQRPNLDGLEAWIHMFRPAVESSIKQATAQAVAAAIRNEE